MVHQMNLTGNESIYSLQSPRQRKQYITEILVTVNKTENNIPIKFQVDTGASCSSITLKDYKKITYEMPEKSNVKFKLYDQSLIQPIGSRKLYCTVNGVRKKVHFEIVEYASTSLLSGRASWIKTLPETMPTVEDITPKLSWTKRNYASSSAK